MCTRLARHCLLFVFVLFLPSREAVCGTRHARRCLSFVCFCLQEKLYPVVRDMLQDAVSKYDSDEASKNFMDSVQTKVRSRLKFLTMYIKYRTVSE